MDATANELISLPAAADMLGCHRTTLHLWVKAGRVEVVTLPPAYRRKGSKRYIRRAEIERLRAEMAKQARE